jgi:hypothetical protein
MCIERTFGQLKGRWKFEQHIRHYWNVFVVTKKLHNHTIFFIVSMKLVLKFMIFYNNKLL